MAKNFFADADRPGIRYRRIINPGQSPRKGRVDEKTGQVKGHRLGEQTIERVTSLCDRITGAPYTWATKETVVDRAARGWEALETVNTDKIPANYPKEWHQQLNDCFAAVGGAVRGNKRIKELEETIKRLEGDSGDESGGPAPKRRKAKGNGRSLLQEVQEASGEERATSDPSAG